MLIQSPQVLPSLRREKILHVFLAGSIETGEAPNWQARFAEEFATQEDILIFNPRREDWDSSWVQAIENVQFNTQVNWELAAMEAADLIIMYFAPGTQSPVTLLELGLYARSGKLVVCCPGEFWRKGNVDIVCRRYGVPQVADVAQLIEFIYQQKNTKP